MKKILKVLVLSILLLTCSLVSASYITKETDFKYEAGIKVINDRIFIDVISKKNSYALEVDTPGAVISNLDVRNSGPGLYTTGIKIVAPNVTIENCNIFDTPVGIAIWSSNNIIVNCTFWGCEDEGIVLLGDTPWGCNNNAFINCVFYKCMDGIELQKSSNNIFINCRFLSNTHAGIDGIICDNNKNLFSFCIFYDSPFGCYFKESEGNEFVDCTFISNYEDIKEV